MTVVRPALVAGVLVAAAGCRPPPVLPAEPNPATDPSSSRFVEIQAHGFGYCALDLGSRLHCWTEPIEYSTLPATIDGVGRGFRITVDQVCWVEEGFAKCVPEADAAWFDGPVSLIQPLPTDYAALDEEGSLHSLASWRFGPGPWSRIVGQYSGICLGTAAGRWECNSYGWDSPEDLAEREYWELDFWVGDACGVGPDGVTCWGDGFLDGVRGSGYTTVEAGARFFCGKSGEGVGCEFAPSHDTSHWRDPPPGSFQDLDCNHSSCCGVSAAGSIECWGDERELELQGQPP